MVNGERASLNGNYRIPPLEKDPDMKINEQTPHAQQRDFHNRIRVPCPASESRFAPVRLVLRYRQKNLSQPFLWFWFRTRIFRDNARIFAADLDNFIIKPENHDFEAMTAEDPLPPEPTPGDASLDTDRRRRW
jgi:hypothetical protein